MEKGECPGTEVNSKPLVKQAVNSFVSWYTNALTVNGLADNGGVGMQVSLQAINLGWTQSSENSASDICLHGGVRFKIGVDTLLEEPSRRFTVRASALYLLRTLLRPYLRSIRSVSTNFPLAVSNS